MKASLIESFILNKIRILISINILEPVTKKTVIESLGNNINGNQIELILSELTKDGFIAREKGWYRTTNKGSAFSISRKANKLRDIQRMEYLLATSKQRGGDSVGR